jgi:hypothetical protein
MSIGSKFPGDDHDAAMSVQHALYGEAVGMLARLARDRLARADLAAGGETVIGSLLRGRTSFDHRVLQAILSALAFQNSPAGYQAEDEARVILKTEYMEWAAG